MIDKHKTASDLTEMFILRFYVETYGVMDAEYREKAIEKYRNDRMFHSRVASYVANTIALFDAALKAKEENNE